MTGPVPTYVVVLYGLGSTAVLISALRMKVPPYDQQDSLLAFTRRWLKLIGIIIGVGGILASLKELSRRGW